MGRLIQETSQPLFTFSLMRERSGPVFAGSPCSGCCGIPQQPSSRMREIPRETWAALGMLNVSAWQLTHVVWISDPLSSGSSQNVTYPCALSTEVMAVPWPPWQEVQPILFVSCFFRKTSRSGWVRKGCGASSKPTRSMLRWQDWAPVHPHERLAEVVPFEFLDDDLLDFIGPASYGGEAPFEVQIFLSDRTALALEVDE